MKRLAATLRLDVRLQARSRLYAIGVGVALLLGVGLRAFLPPEGIRFLLPVFFLGALGGTTFMFVAAMVLLEKSERTIDALTVSPLRLSEYIASKLVTLVGFAIVESLIVMLLAYGWHDIRPATLMLGLMVLGGQYTLIGLAQVAPHESVTDFLIPGAIGATMILQLPALDVLVRPGWGWYLIPTQAPMLLLRAAFGPIERWQWVYAIVVSVVSLAVAWAVARRRISRYMALGRR